MKTHAKKNGHSHNYNLQHDIEKIRSAFADTSYDVKKKAEDLLLESLENLKEKSFTARERVATYTSEKPFQTIGIAMLAGAILAFYYRK